MASGTINHQITYKDFVIEPFIFRDTVTIAANSVLEIVGESVTKTGGWYPLAVSGFSFTGASSNNVYLYSMRISDQLIGSAKAVYRLKNTANSEVTIHNVALYILWVRV